MPAPDLYPEMKIADTITIAGKSKNPLTVHRIGYGTMRLTGEGFYGEPPRRDEALEILRQTAKTGIQFLDTADYYGEDVTNRLIAEALYPYADDLVICTKVGASRKPDKSWIPFNKPENLVTSIENNLRTLKIDQLKLVHLRLMNGTSVLERELETLFALQQEGKILHVGVSNISADDLLKAISIGEIATVENMYGHAQRDGLDLPHNAMHGAEDLLAICEEHEIPMIPFFSLETANSKKDDRIKIIAEKHNATEAQINLAWLLHRSPWLLPIPGTSSLEHFRENIRAMDIELSEEDMAFLD